jgi:hypothetical protein
VVRFRLRAPATVVFTVRGPSPSCSVFGKKWVRGHSGVNRVRLNGRFGRRTLTPGTYEIAVVARRGKVHRSVGRLSVQVVSPGSKARPGSAPVFSCVSSPVAQSGIPGTVMFVSPPSLNRGGGAPPQQAQAQKSAKRSGVLAEPPFHLGGGATDMLLAVLLYSTLGLGLVVLLAYVVRYFRDPFRRYN